MTNCLWPAYTQNHSAHLSAAIATEPVRARLKAGEESQAGDEDRIVVEVSDDGVGLMAAPPTKGTGMGLRNVRERLRLLYGTEASLRIGGAPQGGVVARLEIPLAGVTAPH